MKYICSCSGGKDSIATVILAHEHNEPLDLIVFAEVMFDDNISGELPEHIDFIQNKAFPLFESWGYETKIVRGEKTYMSCFEHIATKGKRIGETTGFPMVGRCVINSRCKVRPMQKFFKKIGENIQYVGIAADEPKRLAGLTDGKISLLNKYGYTQQMAKELCGKYDLVSPMYQYAKRGGCFFCPNAREAELRHLRTNHRELWDRLLELETRPNLIGDMWNTLTKTRINDIEQGFLFEESQMTLFEEETND